MHLLNNLTILASVKIEVFSMKKEKIYLGIYDDYTMQRQLLHHILEREKYEVNYSAATPKLLEEYFEHNPVSILLVHARSVKSNVVSLLEKFMVQTEGELKIIFYSCTANERPELPAVFKKYDNNIFYADDDVHSFYKNLEHVRASFFPQVMQEVVRQKVLLPPEHPFYKIVNSRTMLDILKLLSEGKGLREISTSLHVNQHSIRSYIKKMRIETDSMNIAQLVSIAKEFHLI
jgi:DNA-binding CsgD family transcriptional regulator